MVENARTTNPSLRVRAMNLGWVSEHRGWFIGLGVLFMALGFLAIVTPFAASLVSAVFLGWLLILGGIFQAVHAFQNREWGGYGWALVASAIQIIAGILVVANPLSGTLALTLILGVYFFAIGITKIIRSLQHRESYAWGWLMFDGILSLILGGLIAFGWPSTAVWALGLLVGIDLFFGGSSMFVLGLSAKSPARLGA